MWVLGLRHPGTQQEALEEREESKALPDSWNMTKEKFIANHVQRHL